MKKGVLNFHRLQILKKNLFRKNNPWVRSILIILSATTGCNLETYFTRQLIPKVSVHFRYSRRKVHSERNERVSKALSHHVQGNLACTWPIETVNTLDFVDFDEIETQGNQYSFNVYEQDLWWNPEEILDQSLSDLAQDHLVSSKEKHIPVIQNIENTSRCVWNELCVWESQNIKHALDDWWIHDSKEN